MSEVERKIKTTSGGLKMKTISVLLTKYSDCISTFIYYISGREYTHASIALEEPEESLFLFPVCGGTAGRRGRNPAEKAVLVVSS